MRMPGVKKPHFKTVVKKGKKPPKGGVKKPPKTELQKLLSKWPPKV